MEIISPELVVKNHSVIVYYTGRSEIVRQLRRNVCGRSMNPFSYIGAFGDHGTVVPIIKKNHQV